MDQNINNRHKEILWDLLANPAENGQLYRTTLERLVQDNPQSGLLQVMFARSAATADMNKASAYFSPKALHKIMYDPDGLLPVSRERINISLNDKQFSNPENYFNIGQIAEAEPSAQLSEAPVAENESLITQDLSQPAALVMLNEEVAAETDNPPALPPHTEDDNYQEPVQDYIAPVTLEAYEAITAEPAQPETEIPQQIESKPNTDTQNLGLNSPEVESFEPEEAETTSPVTEVEPPNIAPEPVIYQWHQPSNEAEDDEDPFYDPWDMSKLEDAPEIAVPVYQWQTEPMTEITIDEATGVETAVQPEQTLEPVDAITPQAPVTPVAVEAFKVATYDHSLSGYEQAGFDAALQAPDNEKLGEVSSFDHYRTENVFHHSDDIDDEVFDEIVSIDEIGVVTIGNKFAEDSSAGNEIPLDAGSGEIATQQSFIDDETERLIYGNIAATDYLSFDKKLDELRSGIKAPRTADVPATPPAEENAPAADIPVAPIAEVAPQAAAISVAPAELPAQQAALPEHEPDVVAKYNDESLPYSFMWWLDKTRKEHAGTTQPYVAATPTPPNSPFRPEFNPSQETLVQKPIPDELQQQYYANIFSLTSVSSIGDAEPPQIAFDPDKKEDVIIERFIHTDPHIKPLAADKLDNENKAKKSSEDQDIMVTETLARIYGDQMLYHKAIATYKKLQLKIPEKKLYFASRIEQLEKKIN
ncbi:hypothetical protein A0256_03775 [Mucilaginibacter sp. PAMC 26640]|nr:hypothetical protein A0256_03775 [Mucilaginibacter sp. PAMC 26640]